MIDQADLLTPDLLAWQPPTPRGQTFDAPRDRARLCAQSKRVLAFTLNQGWLTLAQISAGTGDPQASVSARLRTIRAAGFKVERKHVSNGLHLYRVLQLPEGEGPCSGTSSSSASASAPD